MKKCFSNKMEMTFSAQSVNEGFARVCVASFDSVKNKLIEVMR